MNTTELLNIVNYNRADNGLIYFSIGSKINDNTFNNTLNKDDFYKVVNLLKGDKYEYSNKVYKEYHIKKKYNNFILNIYNDKTTYLYNKKLIYHNILDNVKISYYDYNILDNTKYSLSKYFYSEKKINKVILKYDSFFIELNITNHEDNVITYSINLVCRNTLSGIKSLIGKFKKIKIEN
jgi:hypothetical protein